MEQLNKIAAIGGTGKAGKYLVNQLVDQGFKIKVLLRNPEKLETTSHLVEKITGDVRNYESVYNLINGCSAVSQRANISQLAARKLIVNTVSVS
jgi:putative NADH-flavin reductase